MNPLPLLTALLLAPLGLVAVPTVAQAPEQHRIVLPVTILLPPLAAKPLEGQHPDIVRELANKWSKVFRVSKSWIVSQTYVESKFTPAALNPISGAMGIIQIMPRTYAWLLPSLKKTIYMRNKLIRAALAEGDTGRLDDLWNMDFSIMLASYYMRILKRKFGDDHRLVAAAYDAGFGAIAKCLNEGTPFPPQAEEYVARVEAAKEHGFN